MPSPIPFLVESFNETLFTADFTDQGTLPWLRGCPDLWSRHALTECDTLYSKYTNADFISSIWSNAFDSHFRQLLLLLSQRLLSDMLEDRTSTALFNRHMHLVFFHIQCIIASLDIRGSYQNWLRSKTKEPASWLQRILRCLKPSWLNLILHDWKGWCEVVNGLSSTATDSTVLYAMWSRSDLYIGKANSRRKKLHDFYPGVPHRLVEHWEGLCLPKAQNFNRPRYKLFRRHVWSDIRFMPIFLVDQATFGRRIESFVIRTMEPSGNARDNIRQCKTLKFKRVKRRIPPLWIRKRSRAVWSFHSIWSFDFVPSCDACAKDRLDEGYLKKRLQPISGNPAFLFSDLDSAPELPFAELYRWCQTFLLANHQVHGPLHPFNNCSLMFSAMYLSSLRTSETPRTPQWWGAKRTIDWLYRLLFFVDTLSSPIRQTRIWVHVDKWLKWWNLIPRYIPSIGIPGQMFSYCRQPLRSVLHQIAHCIQHPMARRWFVSRIRFHKGKVIRWLDEETGTSTLCHAKFDDLHWDPATRHHLASMPSLISIGSCWKLPIWPTDDLLNNWWSKQSVKWLVKLNLPTRAANWLHHSDVWWRRCPKKWCLQESLMSSAVEVAKRGTHCLVRDDKSIGRMWLVEKTQLIHHIGCALLSSPDWSLTQTCLADQQAAIWAWANVSMPGWARPSIIPPGKIRVPVIKPLIKSKCFASGLGQVCTKPGHSCIRRVVSFSGNPCKSAWRRISACISHMLKSTRISSDVLDISEAPERLREGLKSLPPLACACKRCGVPLSTYGIVVGDIDQAYEQCSRERAWQGWQTLRHEFGEYNFVVDRSDRKHVIVGSDFSHRGWPVPMNMIQRALFCFLATDTNVSVGDTFHQLGGLAMGLVMSGVCLSLNMVQVEWSDRTRLLSDPTFTSDFPIDRFSVLNLRYVDDLLSVSSHLCGPCLKAYLSALYPWNISFSGVSSQDIAVQSFEWLNFKVFFRGTACRVSKIIHNWSWVWDNGERKKFSIVPWCGRHTVQLTHMRSYFICEVKSLASLGLPLHYQVLHLLTIAIEFFLLGYPPKFVIGVCLCNHSSAARVCSSLMRNFMKFL